MNPLHVPLDGTDLRSLADNAPDILWRFNRELRHICVNKAIERAIGKPPASFLGKTIDETGSPPEEIAPLRQALLDVFESGERAEIEHPITTPSGRRYFQSHLAPERDEAGAVTHVIVATRDITDTRAIRLLDAAIQHFPAGVTLVEAPSGRPILLNAEGRRILGTGTQNVASVADYASYVGLRADGTQYLPEEWPVARSLRSGAVIAGEEVEIIRGDGSRADIQISSAPVRDRSGEIIAAAVTFHDVTQARRAQRAQRFVTEATAVLGSSLDSAAIAEELTKLAVPAIADLCMVHFCREDGSVYLGGLHHVDPSKKAAIIEMSKRYELRADDNHFIARILLGGPSELIADIQDEAQTAAARDEEQLRFLRELGYRSAMGMPLAGRQGVFGSISFITGDSGRRYADGDLATIEDLARRAALAIENARLFEAERRARETAERLRMLTEALSRALTPEDAATAVVQQGRAALGARAGIVWLLGADGASLELSAADGHFSGGLSRDQRIHRDRRLPACDALRLGEIVIVGSIEEKDILYPELDDGHESGSKGWIAIPLLMQGHAIGATTLSFAEAPLFTAEDRALMLAMAAQTAQAIERTRLFDTERQTRKALAESEGRLRLALSAAKVGTWRWDLRTSLGTRDASLNRILGIEPIESTQQMADFIACIHPSDRALMTSAFDRSIRERKEYQAELRIVRPDGSVRWARDRGELIYDKRGEPVLMTGALVDLTEQKRGGDRFRFLADATTALASSLNYEVTLAELARLAVLHGDAETAVSNGDRRPSSPAFADWCAVDVVEENGTLRRVALAHRDPAKVALAIEMQKHAPWSPDVSGGVPHVVRTGKSQLTVEITDAMLEEAVEDPARLAHLKALGITSSVVVPLVIRKEVFGAITFVHAESSQHYDAEDVSLAEEIAKRAATALENARLYSALRGSEEKAKAAYEQAKQAERRKDEFLAMLGHELRNPLAPIVTALQLMRLRGSTESEKERELIERQVGHLSRLVDDLLDISKITRGKIELKKAAVRLGEVVSKALEMASPLLERRRHRVTLLMPQSGEDTLEVEADQVRLAQVVANLLTNAAKYTEPGGEIEVRMSREASQVVVRVKDNGIGIPKDLLPTVFDLFVQGYRTLDRTEGGLGIGLTLVRILVEMHEGTVSAYSEGTGKGSEFTVRLPPTQPSLPGEIRMTPLPMSSRLPLQTALVKRRVLVVDDNVDAAETLAEMVTSWGHDVAVAHDGPRALAIAVEFRPDVALLDIGLPIMDGYELASALRSDTRYSGLRLFAITGYGQENDRVKTRQIGFNGHFVKPINLDDLERAIA